MIDENFLTGFMFGAGICVSYIYFTIKRTYLILTPHRLKNLIAHAYAMGRHDEKQGLRVLPAAIVYKTIMGGMIDGEDN